MTVLNNLRDGVSVGNDEVSKVITDAQMYATTPQMLFTVEKSIIENNDKVNQLAAFSEYTITNMNFGIAEVPVTKVDLQKTVQSFTLTDSTGNNTIATAVKNNSGGWNVTGDVIAPVGASSIDVSVEDEKLQGAKLQITYAITLNVNTEKNFDNTKALTPTITGLVDFIDNDLSYNSALGENSKYWEVTTYDEIKSTFASMKYKDGEEPKGTVDPEGNKYTTIVKAKDDNPLLLVKNGEATATITLEKVLSSTDSSFAEIITSTVDTYEYSNIVEISKIDYTNVTPTDPDIVPQRDRVRTPDRYIPLVGKQHDSATSEPVTIHPPTGDTSVNIMYYIIAVISLVILSVGAFGIRKFVLTNKKS